MTIVHGDIARGLPRPIYRCSERSTSPYKLHSAYPLGQSVRSHPRRSAVRRRASRCVDAGTAPPGPPRARPPPEFGPGSELMRSCACVPSGLLERACPACDPARHRSWPNDIAQGSEDILGRDGTGRIASHRSHDRFGYQRTSGVVVVHVSQRVEIAGHHDERH